MQAKSWSSCLLVALGSATAAVPETHPVIERYVEALNSGDVESTLAWFTDDARLVAGPDCTPVSPCVGKAQIRARFVEPMVAQHLYLRIVGFERGPETLQVALELEHDAFKKQGFRSLRGVDHIRVRDGRIASVDFRFDPSHAPTARFLESTARPAAREPGQARMQ